MKTLLSFLLLVFSVSSFGQIPQRSLNANERFVVSTTDKSVTVALTNVYHHVFTFNNPVGSGSKIRLNRILFFASGTNPMFPTSATIFVNPTLVTTFASATINLSIGSPVSDATSVLGYNFSTTGLTGSTGVPYELPLVNGTNILSEPFDLWPGLSFGVDLAKTLTLGLSVNSGYFMIYYTKTPMPL